MVASVRAGVQSARPAAPVVRDHLTTLSYLRPTLRRWGATSRRRMARHGPIQKALLSHAKRGRPAPPIRRDATTDPASFDRRERPSATAPRTRAAEGGYATSRGKVSRARPAEVAAEAPRDEHQRQRGSASVGVQDAAALPVLPSCLGQRLPREGSPRRPLLDEPFYPRSSSEHPFQLFAPALAESCRWRRP